MPDEAPVTSAILMFCVMCSAFPMAVWSSCNEPARPCRQMAVWVHCKGAILRGAQRGDARAHPRCRVAPVSRTWHRGGRTREDHGRGRPDRRHLLHALQVEGGAAQGGPAAL